MTHLIEDERFNTNKKRVQNRELIMPNLEAKLLTKNSDEPASWKKLE